MALIVFDLCDTLYAANTTRGFLQHLGRSRPKVAKVLKRWTSRSSPGFWLGAIAHRLGRDLARKRMVGALAGLDRAELADAADGYVAADLAGRANAPLHEALARHRAAGDRIFILTNSLDPVVQAVAEHLGVEGRGSLLEWNGDRCTGRIRDDLTGRKGRLAAAMRQAGERLVVYTDNRTDRDLVDLADEATIVLPHGRPAERWAGDGCRYVQL